MHDKRFLSKVNRLFRLIDISSPKSRISKYGGYWQKKDSDFYKMIYSDTPKIHEYFQEWYLKQNGINTILDVGCGDGVYGRTIFKNQLYHGVDISEGAIKQAVSKNENKNHVYRVSDFISDTYYDGIYYDLVFSLSVIDHVYDIDKFIRKCVKIAKKYVWITAYYGYYPKLKSHKMEWHPETTCYQNKLSLIQLHNLLNDLHVKYTIESLDYENRKKPAIATIIKIEK